VGRDGRRKQGLSQERFSPVAGILLFESLRALNLRGGKLLKIVSVPLPGFFYLKEIIIIIVVCIFICFSPVAGILLFESDSDRRGNGENSQFQSRCRDSFI